MVYYFKGGGGIEVLVIQKLSPCSVTQPYMGQNQDRQIGQTNIPL